MLEQGTRNRLDQCQADTRQLTCSRNSEKASNALVRGSLAREMSKIHGDSSKVRSWNST